MNKEEKTIIIEPFEECNFKVSYRIKKKKGNKLRPFPHNMQLDNMQLLQEKNYHLFNGDAAIYLKDAEYIKFDHLLYDLPFFKVGEKFIILGYKIMLCNPHFTKEQLIDCLYHIFVHFCHIPKTKNLIDHVKRLGNNISFIEGNKRFTEENRNRIEIGAEQIMNEPFKGKIKKHPKVIYNPDYDLSTEEKREISSKLIGTNKTDNRLEEIYTTYINWNSEEKPTQENIAKKLGVHKNTVKNYWKQVKEKVSMAI